MALAALVQEAESQNLDLQISRLGHRTFDVEYGQEGNATKSQNSPKKRRMDDFVYDTGFVSAGESAEPRERRRVKTFAICTLLALLVSFGAVATYVGAKSGLVGAPSTFRSTPPKTSSWKSPTQVTAAPGVTSTEGGAKCVSNSLDYLQSVADWDRFAQTSTRSWEVLSRVSLGGVQQLLLRPGCWASKGGSIVVNLVKQKGHWELKSAAPLGPHS